MVYPTFEVIRINMVLGADYIEIFNTGLNFNSLNRVEISSRLNSKLLFKITLQLHVKIPFLAKPR